MEPIYIIDAKRTPFLKAANPPGFFSAVDLAVHACRPLLLKHHVPIDEVITGSVMASSKEANIARVIALRVGLPHTVPAYTVHRNCASGMQAMDDAMKDIQLGRADIVLAGGVDAMSRAPLLFNESMVRYLSQLSRAKSLLQKLKTLIKFRPGFLKPEVALLNGLTDPVIGLNMGQTAEELAYRYHITREAMDEFSLRSHQRASKAQFKEIVPIVDAKGKVVDRDDGIREDSSMERLAKLKPFFEKVGSVTAGNSSQITDGAAFLLLASEAAVKKYNLKPRAKIIDVAWAGVDPEIMGIGPVPAIEQLLAKHQLTKSDIDLWEINEAFAAQVLACVKSLDLPLEQLNIYGGAIAQGHPVGASGARIVMQLLSGLENAGKTRGVAGICIGGGQGGALLLERM
jgi:acetyl-CoA C-acetyltransferase